MITNDEFDELMFDFYLFTNVLDFLGVNRKKVFEEDILWDQYRKDDICFNVAKFMYEQIRANYVVTERKLDGQQSLFDGITVRHNPNDEPIRRFKLDDLKERMMKDDDCKELR